MPVGAGELAFTTEFSGSLTWIDAPYLVTAITGRHVRDVRLRRLLDLRMAVAAVKPQLASVNLVVETRARLGRHVSDLEKVRRRPVPSTKHHRTHAADRTHGQGRWENV